MASSRVVLLSLAVSVAEALRPCDTYPNSATMEGFCTEEYANGFGKPRGMDAQMVGGKTHLLVVDALRSEIVLLVDDDGNGKIEGPEKKVLATKESSAADTTSLSHGIAIVGEYVFATSPNAMYRWKYNPTERTLSEQVMVVSDIEAYPASEGGSGDTGGHSTRTIAANDESIFISVGSAENVDASPYRAAIRKVSVADMTSDSITAPIKYADLPFLASGLRNEVGMRFDEEGVLWGVENGVDNTWRTNLGGDVHTNNPPEELNRFDVSQENMFYGYPYCFSEFLLPEEARKTYGHEPGRQWVWEKEIGEADPSPIYERFNDTWCNSDSNVIKPHHGFKPHQAPLGISFLKGECGLSESAWPCSMRGNAFVSFHGSWNRQPAQGYKVTVYDLVTKEEKDVLASAEGGPFPQGTRPVDVVFDPVDGKLFVSQDGKSGSGAILTIRGMNSSYTPSTATPAPLTIAPVTPSPRSENDTDAPDTPVPSSLKPCDTYPNSATLEGFCTEEYANGFGKPRGMDAQMVDGKTHLLVVDALRSEIVLLVDDDGNGKIEGPEKKVLATKESSAADTTSLSHGIAIVGEYVFATSPNAMYRWKYNPTERTLSEQVMVVSDIEAYPTSEGGSGGTGGHSTRTIAANDESIFISVGSVANVDASPYRAAIRKVSVADMTSDSITAPIKYADLPFLASGLRNEVGMRFDEEGVLWGVENGVDNTWRTNLGGDVHTNNPPEELNRFDVSQENMFYGYPYCFSEFLLPEEARRIYGHEPGRQWVWEKEIGEADPSPIYERFNDTWCNSDSNVIKPHHGFKPHQAPLGISFLKGECGLSESAWPCSMRGNAFVSFHGSWNRQPAQGYKVTVYDLVTKEEKDVLASAEGGPFPQGTRPVDVVFDPVDGKLFVSQDGKSGSGAILTIRGMNSSYTPSTFRLVVFGVFRDAQCGTFMGDPQLRLQFGALLLGVTGVEMDISFVCGSLYFVASGDATQASTHTNLLSAINTALDSSAYNDLADTLGKADSVSTAVKEGGCELPGATQTAQMDTCIAVACANDYTLGVQEGTPVCMKASDDSSGLSTLAIVGIVSGSVAGGALIIGLILYTVIHCRRKEDSYGEKVKLVETPRPHHPLSPSF